MLSWLSLIPWNFLAFLILDVLPYFLFYSDMFVARAEDYEDDTTLNPKPETLKGCTGRGALHRKT